MKRSGGFTLIELLVVIAIIGILSSVVLASLNTARDKGGISAIQEAMVQLRNEVELYSIDNNFEYASAQVNAGCLDVNTGILSSQKLEILFQV